MQFQIGQTVRCVKADPADDHYQIPNDKRWKIGDEFKVAKIEVAPYGTFLHDSEGHNLNASRALVINTPIRTLGLYQPFAGLMAIGAKAIETRWIRQGRKPPFPPGEYLIYSTLRSYNPIELSQIAGNQYERLSTIQHGDKWRIFHEKGKALCVGTLTKHIYILPGNRDMEKETFVRYTGPEKRIIGYHPDDNSPMYATFVLIGLVFENVRAIDPFQVKGKQGIGFLSEDGKSKIKFL